MEIFLEIIKTTVPALIVFFTVYFIMSKYLENQLKLRKMEYQQNITTTNSSVTVPLKLNAYERLALFCERISVNNLLLRLPTQDQSAAALRVGMMLAIQQEYEHNMSQQVYISENLWAIIKLAKEDTLVVINGLYDQAGPDADAKTYARIMNTYLDQIQDLTTLQKAQMAIRKEASVLLG